MDYATFDNFRDSLMPHLPGANPEAVKSAFFLRAQDFYRSSRSWREVLGGFTFSYDMPLTVWLQPVDDKADIAYVEQVWWQNSDERPALPTSRANTLSWTVDGAQELRVNTGSNQPAPQDRLVWVQVSCQPTLRHDAPVLPPLALTHHRETLVSGTLATLLASPKKPYTDITSATLHERRFIAGMAKWRATQDKGYTPVSLRARSRAMSMR